MVEHIAEIPLVAIVGRPNVGKSRLFNRLTQSQAAIVEGTPGVTRDRHYGEVNWYGRVFNLVDTGGFEPDTKDQLLSKMREQAEIAIAEADLVLVIFDGQDGPVQADAEIVDLLRRGSTAVVYAVNKIDGPKHDVLVHEFHELGVGPLFSISAEHGLGVDDLMDHLSADFPDEKAIEEAREALHGEGTLVAVVGRPNVGKSTLVNQLIGEERLLTSDMPGTTRDAIDTVVEQGGQRFVLIDTAGVRRRRSIDLALEKYSVIRAFKSIDRAEVVLFLLDAIEGPTDQDARLLGLVADKGRSIVLVVNKWDLVEKDHRTLDEYTKALRERFFFCKWAPLEFISAKTGKRVRNLLPAAMRARDSWRRRITTSELNTFLEDVVARNQPPIFRNRRVKMFYMAQVKVAPPAFAVFCNYPEAVPSHYRRFMSNQLREAYGFEGTPLKIWYRKRSQKKSFE